MQQGRFRREDMIHHPGAQPHGYVSILIPRGVDWFCLAGMGRFWKAPKPGGHDSHFGCLDFGFQSQRHRANQKTSTRVRSPMIGPLCTYFAVFRQPTESCK